MALMLLPLLVRAVAMGAAARRSALGGAGAPPAQQAQPARPAAVASAAQQAVDNYVLRVKEALPAAPAPSTAAPEPAVAESSAAPPQPAPAGPPPSEPIPLAALLNSLPELQRAWVSLEVLGPPRALREHSSEPWPDAPA